MHNVRRQYMSYADDRMQEAFRMAHQARKSRSHDDARASWAVAALRFGDAGDRYYHNGDQLLASDCFELKMYCEKMVRRNE